MYFSRHIESVVVRIASRKPVVVLTGARQVGKSTMLKEVFQNINYVTLNRPLVRESAKNSPSIFFEENKPPVIVDEIQKATELFDYTKLVACIHKGFFPELYEVESDLYYWADFHSSYFQTYIEKDIKDVLNIRDETAFIKFVKATASLTGEMLNFTKLSEICGKDVKTVKSWMSALESSGLVYLLEPYYNNFNKRMTKTPKLYFLDTGLACWLLGWNTPKQLTSGAMWGDIFESFVFCEILKSYYNDGIARPPLYYYRDKDKNEIDIIIEDGGVLYPVVIKTTSDPTISMANSFRHLDKIPGKIPGSGAVICLANKRLPLNEKVWILPAGSI